MIIHRDVLKLLKNDLGKQKALLIMGARQVGKTTLLRALSDFQRLIQMPRFLS